MRYLILIFLPFSVAIKAYEFNSNDARIVYVKMSINDDSTVYQFEIPKLESYFQAKKVWDSQMGIRCIVLLSRQNNAVSGQLECVTPEEYKAQVSFDCSKNYSQDNSTYLFFGKVGRKDNNKNFYIWCQ